MTHIARFVAAPRFRGYWATPGSSSLLDGANVHLRWSIEDSWVMSVGVRNLLEDANLEYVSELGDVVPTAIERTAFLNLRYSF